MTEAPEVPEIQDAVEPDADAPADDRVMVYMRGHARGHKAGQRRYFPKAEAEALVANRHADWPKSKQ